MKRFQRLAGFFSTAPINPKVQKVVKKIKNYFKTFLAFSERRPLVALIVILALLFVLIAVGSVLRRPEVEEVSAKAAPKQIKVYTVGAPARISVAAQIEKAGVIKIVAQTAGVVNRINVDEGQTVWRGQNLISLSSNYSGGNTFSLQRQLAEKQYQNVLDTFDAQKDVISKQRDLAEKTDGNNDQLRKITEDSIDETRSLIKLNDEIIKSIEDVIAASTDPAVILTNKQLKSQFVAANNQLKTALRTSEFRADEDKDAVALSNLQKDLALKQLEIQQKGLELSRETSKIMLKIARVNESLMFPTSPFEGKVERIHVKEGGAVNPGTVLATISSSGKDLSAVALLPLNVVNKISQIEPSLVYVESEILEILPVHIATEATDGQLYAVVFSLPESFNGKLTDKGFIDVEVPLGLADTTGAIPFVPLDAIFQTQEKALVFVVEDDTAISREVVLGPVQGSFAEVLSGLSTGDVVILTRNVINGDKVTPLVNQ